MTAETAPFELSIPAVPRSTSEDGHDLLFPDRDRYHDVVARHREAGFEMLAGLTAVDYLGHPGRQLPEGVKPERFELVVMLLSLAHVRRVRIRVQVPEEGAEVASLWDLYRGAEAMEREAYDMYGITFTGHPDLTRILMPEDWEGHPLRKDFGVGRVPVQFKHAPGPR
ncbi:MAG TPA: NADH-quinone oxidoreductase subunit C [Acidimicrobiales bacterium]|nr:NADH-quinone oxidoreductase subunit C [Acidimicrobiales bacterium]